MARGPRRGSAAGDRRLARKLAEKQAASHPGLQGLTILEMLERQLAKVADLYVAVDAKQTDYVSAVEWHTAKQNARGQIRGLCVAIAMMRHPLRRYETAWWDYVKKKEKGAVSAARRRIDDDVQ